MRRGVAAFRARIGAMWLADCHPDNPDPARIERAYYVVPGTGKRVSFDTVIQAMILAARTEATRDWTDDQVADMLMARLAVREGEA